RQKIVLHVDDDEHIIGTRPHRYLLKPSGERRMSSRGALPAYLLGVAGVAGAGVVGAAAPAAGASVMPLPLGPVAWISAAAEGSTSWVHSTTENSAVPPPVSSLVTLSV